MFRRTRGATVLSDLDRMTAVDEPLVETIRRRRAWEQAQPKRQPRYRVILWDDNDHSYDYVVDMMRRLFGHPVDKGVQIAKEVDMRGSATCLTTTREHAELKRDQIHAFGRDNLIARCAGSMSASIEPESE
jgi:ATP-dependent Clp protease adaptor protein ClpS